ncbi:MAG: hypothetical protein H0W61_00300 [Bacteroidetes bacterium]|nr:hypothetical protein [Bacteroidota bacterium]
MVTLKHKVLLLFVFISLELFCLTVPPSRSVGSGIRIFFGPAYGFYQLNKNHATNAAPKMSAIAGFRKEIRFDREFRTFFLFGVDYFFHGVNFKSYYFKPDSLKLYDKTFPYDYSLFIHEIDLPLQMKFSFSRENNSLFSAYAMVGYHLRYLLPSRLTVTQNGNTVKTDDADLKFKNPFIDSRMNSMVSFTFGWQKNGFNSSRSSFFMELNFRYGFSPYYFEKSYAATSLYTNATHLSLLIGIKF